MGIKRNQKCIFGPIYFTWLMYKNQSKNNNNLENSLIFIWKELKLFRYAWVFVLLSSFDNKRQIPI